MIGPLREGNIMVTADDIRARVREADERRIKARGDRAADVADARAALASARAALVDAEAAFAQTVKSALDVMSATELAEFVDVPPAELMAAPSRPARRAARSRKKAPAAKSGE